MNKLFIGLLIVSFGAGTYFYFTSKQQSPKADLKELIVGSWKLDSIKVTPPWSQMADSSLPLVFSVANSDLYSHQLAINKEGLIIRMADEKAIDTSQYEFINKNELRVWSKGDSSQTNWLKIIKLDSLNLIVQHKDSAIFTFKKIH